jgi:MOSC domain-containing protein YiiM
VPPETPPMSLLSINVGLPREVGYQGKTVTTSIFKSPVSGRVRVTALNVEGDRQSDLSVHGGVDKAVYIYPSEHYEFWRNELPGTTLSWGAFGENLTTLGLDESTMHIGDTLRIGTAEFSISQPRMPCFKLGIRFGRPDILKRFLQSGRTGFYLRVQREGDIQAGDPITVLSRDEQAITVSDIVGLYTAHKSNQDLLRRVTELPALPEDWRDFFRKQLPDKET